MMDDKFLWYTEPAVFAHGHKDSTSAEFLLRQFENKIFKTQFGGKITPLIK